MKRSQNGLITAVFAGLIMVPMAVMGAPSPTSINIPLDNAYGITLTATCSGELPKDNYIASEDALSLRIADVDSGEVVEKTPTTCPSAKKVAVVLIPLYYAEPMDGLLQKLSERKFAPAGLNHLEALLAQYPKLDHKNRIFVRLFDGGILCIEDGVPTATNVPYKWGSEDMLLVLWVRQ